MFVCSAIGLILLNFDAVAEYVVYTFSNLVSTKKAYQQVIHQEYIPQQLDTPQTKRINPILSIGTFIKRILNLIKAIFIPDIQIDLRPRSFAIAQNENFVQKLASKETNKLNLKTYSAVDQSNHTDYKLSYAPTEHLGFFDKIKPKHEVAPVANQEVTPLSKKVNQDPMNDPINMISMVKANIEKIGAEDSKKVTFNTKKPFLASESPNETIEPIKQPANVTNINLQQVVKKEQLSHPEQAPQSRVVTSTVMSENSFSLGGLLSKIMLYGSLILPLAVVLTSIVIYLLERSSNTISSSYLEWISSQISRLIEPFVGNN